MHIMKDEAGFEAAEKGRQVAAITLRLAKMEFCIIFAVARKKKKIYDEI